MAVASTKTSNPLALIHGDDDYNVRQRARALFDQWCQELGGMDHEIVEAGANTVDEAVRCLRRLREALNTLPFFGGGKVVWFKDCTFLGDDRTAGSATITENLSALGEDLKVFKWDNVRLLISAAKVDKRKSFYKTIEKNGTVEVFAGLSLETKDWADQAERHVFKEIQTRNKEIAEEALAELVTRVGPNLRQLTSEAEKLSLYVGDRKQIGLRDVLAVVSQNKQARAFALGDALGDRNLPKLLRTLDEELWAMQFDKKKSEVGMLYGLISKVRAMLFMKEAMREKLLSPTSSYGPFKAQLERLPAEKFAAQKEFSPLATNPYVLFRAAQQSQNYTSDELVRAMNLLLQCNIKLVTSGADEAIVLQQTVMAIAGQPPGRVR
ncbi:MAG: DNA polymerase III subunit delta [Verrucomicrobiota bacterium]